jgi:hypothetical protein
LAEQRSAGMSLSSPTDILIGLPSLALAARPRDWMSDLERANGGVVVLF